MNHSIDERQIQRVIDNECSAEERHNLMAALDGSPDGWKKLACAFLEDQLFTDALGAEPGSELARNKQTSTTQISVQRNWFHHPAVSFALTACLAFMLGILVTKPFDQSRPNAMAASEPTDKPDVATSNGQLASASPRLTLRPEGQEPVSIPVVNNVSEFVSGIQRLRQPESQWPEEMPATLRGSLKFYKIRSGDEIFLVPVSDRFPEHSIH